jgi:hypothetical protein
MRTIPALGSLIALLAIAAYALNLPPFSSPTFFEPGRHVYMCTGGEGPSLPIGFSTDGRVATVEAAGRKVAMRFTSGFSNDVYRNGEWVLTLDPEANLTGPEGVSFSNCT